MNFYDSGNDEKESSDGFAPVKPGTYKAVINDVTSKEYKGDQTLSLQYKLENNRRLFQNFKFNDTGKKWLTWQLGDLGVLSEAKKTAKENETIEQTVRNIHNTIAKSYIGKVVTIEVTHSDWTNPTTKVKKTYENIKIVPNDTAPMAPSTQGDDDDDILF
jgi:hypothetical protein